VASGPIPIRSSLTVALFAIYSLLLIGLILFKIPFSYQDSSAGRELNLIPLAGSFTGNGTFRYGEVIENVLVFVPLGIYICMLKPIWSFAKKIVPIVATTVAFEVIQYAFAVGRADITDVRIIGIGMYAALSKILGNGTRRVLNLLCLVLTVGALLLFVIVLMNTLRRR
jgi:glycopeptide antibiotics resistance protein